MGGENDNVVQRTQKSKFKDSNFKIYKKKGLISKGPKGLCSYIDWIIVRCQDSKAKRFRFEPKANFKGSHNVLRVSSVHKIFAMNCRFQELPKQKYGIQ